MTQREFVIGVLGGMGTYATVHLFQQYADVFCAEKEWDRPRMVIDNRCTMPSRVRAFLYNENTEKLVEEMTESISLLMEAGCSHILLACNTSHLFLPHIYNNLPGASRRIVHIIDTCVQKIAKDQVKEVFLLASEGTIDSGIYQKALANSGITCIVPKKEEYEKLRECIEAVKQNKYKEEVKKTFQKLMEKHDTCILGCTELPILYEKYQMEINDVRVYDPLKITLNILKEEFERCEKL